MMPMGLRVPPNWWSVCVLLLAGLFPLTALNSSLRPVLAPPTRTSASQTARLPVSFEVNQGQADSRFPFLSRGAGHTLFLKATETSLRVGNATLRTRLMGADPSARVHGADPQAGRVNYFIGNDPAQWRRNIPLYGKVACDDVYPGVDALYYGAPGSLEYDFVVRPGADPAAIRLEMDGAKRAELDAGGDLVLHTEAGEVRHKRPRVYQEVGGQRREIEGSYRLADRIARGGPAEVSFQIGEYDRTRALVIDPVVLYSSYFGGTADVGLGDANVAADNSGNAYLTGATHALDMPVTPGAMQPAKAGPSSQSDVYVAKIATDQSGAASLVYCTYLGGSSVEYPTFQDQIGIALGPDGSVYVAANTVSPDFPTTPGALDRTYDGSLSTSFADGFIVRIDPTGSSLIYGTYLGSMYNDQLSDIAVDAAGNAYVTGWGPAAATTPGAYVSSEFEGEFSRAGFIIKLNLLGTGIVYSSRIGSRLGDNFCHGIAVDPAGAAYITGWTNSSNFPVTPGAFDTSYRPGNHGFAAKLSTNGSTLLYATYIRGTASAGSRGYDVAAGPGGTAYLTGFTSETDFAVTSNAFEPVKRPSGVTGVYQAGYFTVLNAAGSALEYSTYISGHRGILAFAVAVDPGGVAYVTGNTNSDVMSLKNTLKPGFIGDLDHTDAFVAAIDPSQSGWDSLRYLTLFGGTWGDVGTGIAADADGNVYVTGHVYSPDFPTVNAFQPTDPPGGPQTFLVRLAAGPRPAPPTSLAATVVTAARIDLTWTDASTNETGFQVERATTPGAFTRVAALPAGTVSYQDEGLAPSTTYLYRVRAVGEGGGSLYSNTASADTLALPPPPASNLTAQLLPPASVSLQWDESPGAAGYRIERSADGFAQADTVAVVGAAMSSYTDPGLARNTVYSYRVLAFTSNPSGTPSDASPSNVAAAMTRPAAPTDLLVTAAGSARLNLTWADSNTAGSTTTFELFRSPDGGHTFPPTPTATVSGVATGTAAGYADLGLAANTRYVYRLRAVAVPPGGVAGGGPSADAGPAEGTTLPLPVTGLTAEVIEPTTGVHLAWSDPNPGGVETRVERSPDGFAANVQVVAQLPAGAAAYDDTGTQGNTPYAFRVVAHNAGGAATGSPVASCLTLPAIPDSVTASAPTDGSPRRGRTQIDLSWSYAAAPVAATQVERSTDGGMTYALVATVSAPATRYTDTGRAEDTSYTYRLRGANASGVGDDGDPVEVRTLKAPPASPTGLQLTVASAGQINLTWTNGGGGADGIRIDRKKSGEAVYTPRTTLSPGAAAFQDTGLAPATLYAYRVAAFNNGGDSEPPAAGSATTLPLPPAAPTGLTVAAPPAPAGRTRLEIAWTDASTNETGFALQQSTDGVNWSTPAPVPAPTPAGVGGTVTTAVEPLNPNTQYRFRVAAVNTGGQSAWVGPQAGTTLPLPPAAPSGLSVMTPPKPDGSNRLTVSWTDASTSETAFALQRSLDGAKWTDLAPVPTPNPGGVGGAVQVTASPLASDTLYYFRVAAVNTGGNSAWVGPQSAKTLPLPPKAPEGLNATAPPPPLGRTTLSVAWTDASSNETAFALQKSLDGVSWTSLPDVPTPGLAESGEVVTAQVDSLQPKTRYYFRVAAVNPGGPSAWSTPASAATLPLPPSAPTGLTVTAPPKPDGLSKLVLSWTDAGPGETGFQVERQGLSGEFAAIAQVGPNDQSFTDTGLRSNTQYIYRVRAFNSGGESDPTLAAAGATLPDLPNAPLNLTVSVPPAPAGIAQLLLAWHDGSSNETGFRIERQDSDGVFTEIGTAGANHIVYPVTGLQPATAYTFRVRAYNADGNSAPSNTASKTTLPNPPGSPNLTSVTALFPRELRLEWSYPGSDQTGFQVERSTNGSSFFTAASIPADAVSWTDSGLSPATPYYYRVRAVNSGGASAPSSVVSGATLADLYSIRGVVASGSDGVAGVTVSAGGKSTVTASDGSFALAGLAPGAYQVTPSKSQYVFDPPSRSVTVGPDWDGLRFNAVPPFLFTLDGTGVRGGKPARARIVLREAPSVAIRITLQSSDPGVARAPAQVRIKKGKGSIAFAAPTRRVTAAKEVTLSATLGDVTQTVRLTVFPR